LDGGRPCLGRASRNAIDCCYHRFSTVSLDNNAEEPPGDDPNAVGPGTRLDGRFVLVRLLGEGGMGRVYLATDTSNGAEVAVKVLSDDRPIPNAAARFQREARAIARIEHDNVVRVDHVGASPKGGLYYVMEHLQGEDLAELLEREGRLPWPRVLHFALQVCDGLQAAHERGVVHRDLKLENCFRVTRGDDRDFVKILDFGVAKLLRPDPEQSDRLTNTGATLGTPAYMAPELCRGREIDHRVDVYALGVMLYELLTGELPFTGEGFLDVALQHMHEPPPSLAVHLAPSEIPPGLDAVIERALAKSRDDRVPTMAAFARALRSVGEPRPEIPLPFVRQDGQLPLVGRGGTVPALDARDPSATDPRGVTGVHDPSDAHEVIELRRAARLRGTIAAVAMMVLVFGAGGLWWWQTRTESKPAIVDAGVEPQVVVPSGPTAVDAKAQAHAHAQAHDPIPRPSQEPTPSDDPAPVEEPTTQASEATEDPAPVAGARRDNGLSRAEIDAALRRVRPRMRTCVGDLTGGSVGDRLDVELRIDRATGKVTSAQAKARGTTTTAVEGCVEQAMLQARFDRRGQGVQRISRRITL
jgi:serine/threonine protein kinase